MLYVECFCIQMFVGRMSSSCSCFTLFFIMIVQFANGDMYQGDYVKDQRSGVGKYTWKDGRVYEGRYVK